MKHNEVTARFVQAMKTIIAEKIMSGEKYSQVDFADSIDYTRANISRVANLDRDVNLPMVVKLAKVHGISPNWLILGIGEMKLGKIEKTNGKKITLEERVKKLEGIVIKKAAS